MNVAQNSVENKYRNLGSSHEPGPYLQIKINICKSRSMNKYLILIPSVFFVLLTSAQTGFGFDAGIGTSKAPMIAVKYFFGNNAASIGATYQVFNDALGKKHDYLAGTTAIGDGDYFYSIDVGYTRILNENFSISGDVSIGEKKYYQNLRDDNSPQGGYHQIYKSKSQVGGGAYLTYNFNTSFGLFAGYNSLRGGTFGLEFRFLKDKQY